MGFRKFDSRYKQTYTPHYSTIYTPFDAKLTVAGEPVRFIVDPSQKNEFFRCHFKFLGRWINADLDEVHVTEKVKVEFLSLMRRTDKAKINGLMKLYGFISITFYQSLHGHS